MSRPFVAVLVLNYNGRNYLSECFHSLGRQTWSQRKVYLVDNGSTDGSVAYVRRVFPWVKLISLPRNYGFAEAYNRAAQQVREPYIVFLNNDTHLDPQWLERLIQPTLHSSRVGVCGSRMLFAAAPSIINHGGGYFTLTGIGLDRDFGKKVFDPRVPRHPFLTAYACGGALLIRTELFWEVGGFDSEYFIYFEDVDLCYRCWLKGYQVMHVPDSLVYHHFSPVFGAETPAKIFLCQKNRLSNMLKHQSLSLLPWSVLVSLAYDIQRGITWTINGEREPVKAMVKGYIAAIRRLNLTFHDRPFPSRSRFALEQYMRAKGLLLSLRASLRELRRLRKVKAELFSALNMK